MDFTRAYTTEQLTSPNGADWYMDSGATTHLAVPQVFSIPVLIIILNTLSSLVMVQSFL